MTTQIEGSRRNIEEHYDAGNAIYKLFLDETMTYSSGIHRPGTQTSSIPILHIDYSKVASSVKSELKSLHAPAGDSLKQAQLNKLDALIERAGISKTDHVLEIGCGWGSMAIHAVQVRALPARTHTLQRRQTTRLVTPCGTCVTLIQAVSCAAKSAAGWGRVRLTVERSFLHRHVPSLACSVCDVPTLAMQKTGCTWTGVTVSKQQLEEAVARVKAAGLSDSIKLLFCDYREGHDLGTFDKVHRPQHTV